MADSMTATASEFQYRHTTVQSGTSTLLLQTQNTFVDKDLRILTYTPQANIGGGSATSSIQIDNSTTGNSTNVQSILINGSNTRPNTAGKYYIGFNITASGNSQVNTAGWIATGTDLGSGSTSLNKFYEVTKALGKVTNNASVSIAVTATPTNVVTSTSDNGIKIAIAGGATASGSITATVTAAGYHPAADLAKGTVSASNSTSKNIFITGVTVPKTTFTVTAQSNTAGTIQVSAYPNNTTATRDAIKTIVTNGVWNTTTVSPSAAQQGPYYGKTVVLKTTTSGYSAANIRAGATIVVKGGSTNIYSVAGTFSATSTVSSKTPAAAGQILTGYAAFMDGQQLNGTMKNNGALNKTITTQNGTITVTAGYYSGGTVTAKFDTTQVTQNAWAKSSTNIITTTGATWGKGYISSAGSISPVTFSNTSNGGTFIELSNAKTSTSVYLIPEVGSDKRLYITRGYIDNVSIDIGRLIPDVASVSGLVSGYILSGHSAYDQEGNLISGNIGAITLPTAGSGSGSGTNKGTLYATTSDQYITIPAGYLESTANYKFNKISATNYSAGNIKYGVGIIVSNGSSNVWAVTGTWASDGNINAADVRVGKIGYKQATKVTGTMPDTSASSSFVAPNLTIYFSSLGSTVTTGNISITPRHTVTTAGYIATANNQAGTTFYYNIRTASLAAKSGTAILVSDTATKSIYASSNTHGISIGDSAPSAAGKVYIKIKGSGSVASSTTGWVGSTNAIASTTSTRYITLDLYTGGYQISDG